MTTIHTGNRRAKRRHALCFSHTIRQSSPWYQAKSINIMRARNGRAFLKAELEFRRGVGVLGEACKTAAEAMKRLGDSLRIADERAKRWPCPVCGLEFDGSKVSDCIACGPA